MVDRIIILCIAYIPTSMAKEERFKIRLNIIEMYSLLKKTDKKIDDFILSGY